jgi:3-oxoacyl-[acyl-carrier protein] reductase
MGMLSGKTAMVTGGARGIGAAIVAAFAEQGATVLAPTRQELDLADPGAPRRYVEQRCRAGVDILVNNAGINFVRSLDEIDDPLWSQTMQVNLHAPLQLMQLLSPSMRQRRWGRIVNMSSVFSVVTKEKRAIYSATKAGLNGLTRTAAVELGPAGVLVNAVCPGFVETELTRQNNSPADIERLAAAAPVRRLAQPVEIARFVRFLCSEENTFITGQSLVIDGGFSCL